MCLYEVKPVNILVTVKQAGKRRDRIAALPFALERTPHTLRELICELVRTCTAQYNERVRRGESSAPLSDVQMDAMSETGKFAFGINYGGKEACEKDALETALQAFEDGLFRVFLNERELTEPEAPLSVRENDRVLLIRLTMLAGSMF